MKMLNISIKERFREYDLLSIIVLSLIIFMFIYVVLGFITNGKTVYDSMFGNKTDIFMDYFNSIYYSLDGPYTNHSVIYPPLVVWIYELIGHFIVVDGVIDPFQLRASYFGMFSYMIATLISIIFIYNFSVKYVKKINTLFSILIFLMLMSYPVVFAIMRGNCILYAVLFVMLFLFGYKSDNKTVRYLAYLCLGLSAGFKIYTILFGILVIKERNIKDVVVCVIIGLLVFLVPFLFTDGNPLLFFENAFGYSLDGSVPSQIINISDIFSILYGLGLSGSIIKVLCIGTIIASYLVTIIIVVMNKNLSDWETITIISANIIFGFGTSVSYAFVLMIPALLIFIRDESYKSKRNIVVAILFSLIFAVFPGISFLGGRSYFLTIKGLSVMAIYIIIVATVIKKYGFIDKCDKHFHWDNCRQIDISQDG